MSYLRYPETSDAAMPIDWDKGVVSAVVANPVIAIPAQLTDVITKLRWGYSDKQVAEWLRNRADSLSKPVDSLNQLK